jgi:predicted nucleotidyltransferase
MRQDVTTSARPKAGLATSPPLDLPKEVADQVRVLGARYGIRRIRVFGSVARGEARPDSDIDLLVDYEPGHGGFAFVDFCESVERLLGRRVDVVTERSLHPLIRDRVLARAVPL